MSQFVITDSAADKPDPVNLDNISSFHKAEGNTNSDKNKQYQIHFVKINSSVGPEILIWKFKEECDRDKVYNDLITNFVNKV